MSFNKQSISSFWCFWQEAALKGRVSLRGRAVVPLEQGRRRAGVFPKLPSVVALSPEQSKGDSLQMRGNGVPAGRAAFTLLEMLAAITIVSVLSALLVVAVGKMRLFAERGHEVSAARTLISAFHMASQEKGRLFSGSDRTEVLYDLAGNPIPSGLGGIYTSYVFYLMPYLGYEVNGTVIVNRQQREVMGEFASAYGNNREYALSIYPALGMNMWVGGNYDTHGNVTNASYALTRLDDAVNPGNMIVFSSAGIRETWPRAMTVHGRYQVTPPRNMSEVSYWANRDDADNPARHGYVHFRWEGHAVVAHLDGSVKLLDLEQMRDMRRWSNDAAMANDPTWFRGK